MECPKTQYTLNESPKCDNDTYQHKQYSSLLSSEKTLSRFYSNTEMIDAIHGICLANLGGIFESRNDSFDSGFAQELASKKYVRMVLLSMPIERSTRISSKTICPPLISNVCNNPIVFVYIIGVLLFTICFILGFILNKAYRNQSTITTMVYPEPSIPPPAPPPPPSNTGTMEDFTNVLATHDKMNEY